jgi:hypothetical protein
MQKGDLRAHVLHTMLRKVMSTFLTVVERVSSEAQTTTRGINCTVTRKA